MKIKVSEATSTQLDWMVAKVNGLDVSITPSLSGGYNCVTDGFKPTTSWAQGGVILEREKITVGYERYGAQGGETWDAVKKAFDDTVLWLEYGPTPLIAAMRCHVASRLGNEVDVPEELAALVKGE